MLFSIAPIFHLYYMLNFDTTPQSITYATNYVFQLTSVNLPRIIKRLIFTANSKVWRSYKITTINIDSQDKILNSHVHADMAMHADMARHVGQSNRNLCTKSLY